MAERLDAGSESPRLEFVLVVEGGLLEHMAMLLCDSIRANAGRYRHASITAISPDAGRRPSSDFRAFADRSAVHYLERSLAVECPEYKPANRIYAAAEREAQSAADILVVCDSDTWFLREPDFDLHEADVAVRPVDVKGICTVGRHDSFDPYWQRLCALGGIDYERLPLATPALGSEKIKACYNAGLAVVRRRSGILQKTAELFGRSLRAGLCPRVIGQERVFASTGFAGDIASAYWGTSQAALSLAIWSSTDRVQLLAPTYNLPLHLWDLWLQRHPAVPLDSVVHVHYHWLCNAGYERTNPMLDGRLPLTQELAQQIRRRTPFPDPTSQVRPANGEACSPGPRRLPRDMGR